MEEHLPSVFESEATDNTPLFTDKTPLYTDQSTSQLQAMKIMSKQSFAQLLSPRYASVLSNSRSRKILRANNMSDMVMMSPKADPYLMPEVTSSANFTHIAVGYESQIPSPHYRRSRPLRLVELNSPGMSSQGPASSDLDE